MKKRLVLVTDNKETIFAGESKVFWVLEKDSRDSDITETGKMTEYSFPKQPSGPLWDDTGQKWVKSDNGVRWVMEGTEYGYSWSDLVIIRGPLTDVGPLEEGDDIGFDWEDYSDFPEGTAVATSTSVYQWRDGVWRSPGGVPYKKISDFADQKVDQEVRVVFIPLLEDREDSVSSAK